MAALDALIARLQDEPVLVTTLVSAVIGLLIAFGVPITVEGRSYTATGVATVVQVLGCFEA